MACWDWPHIFLILLCLLEAFSVYILKHKLGMIQLKVWKGCAQPSSVLGF